MMLSVVALAFLSLGSSKHMEFKNCGKFVFPHRFFAVFVPMQGHYDHVTVLENAVREPWKNRALFESWLYFCLLYKK